MSDLYCQLLIKNEIIHTLRREVIEISAIKVGLCV